MWRSLFSKGVLGVGCWALWAVPAWAACTLSPANIPDVVAGQVVSMTFTASGCSASSYTITAGSLAGSGLTLNAASGILSGTVNSGFYSFTVSYSTASQAYTLTAGATFQQWTQALRRSMLDAQFRAAGLPQPPIQMASQQTYLDLYAQQGGRGAWSGAAFTGGFGTGTCNPLGTWNTTAACPFNNVTNINALTDALWTSGVRALDVNIDVITLIAASEYTTAISALSAGAYTINSDCPGGTTVRYAYGSAPPAGTGNGAHNWACATLYVQDQTLTYAHNKGMQIRLRVKPDSLAPYSGGVGPCGWTSSTTDAQFAGCYEPLVLAAVMRWGGLLDVATLIHEAVGGFMMNLPFAYCAGTTQHPCNTNEPNIANYISTTASAIRAIPNSTIRIAACADTVYAADSDYMTNLYIGNSALTDVCIDLYPRDCDPALYGQNVLSIAQGWAALARAAGQRIQLQEGGALTWLPYVSGVPASCPGAASGNAYAGSGWGAHSTAGVYPTTAWGTIGATGTNDMWLEAAVPLLSSWGVTGLSIYAPEWLITYESSPTLYATDFTFSGYPYWLEDNMAAAPSESGKAWMRLSAWPGGGPASLQGNARLAGGAHIGN